MIEYLQKILFTFHKMNLADLRVKVRAFILGIAGIIVVFLFLRVALDIIGAARTNILVNLIGTISDVFIFPLKV
jgi:hypothetical protein